MIVNEANKSENAKVCWTSVNGRKHKKSNGMNLNSDAGNVEQSIAIFNTQQPDKVFDGPTNEVLDDNFDMSMRTLL